MIAVTVKPNQTWYSLSMTDLAQPGQSPNSGTSLTGSSLTHIRPDLDKLNTWTGDGSLDVRRPPVGSCCEAVHSG